MHVIEKLPEKYSGPQKKEIRNRQKNSERDKYKNVWDAMRFFFCNSCNWRRQLQLEKTAASGGSLLLQQLQLDATSFALTG